MLPRTLIVTIALVSIIGPSVRSAEQVGTINAVAGTGENTSPDQGNLGDGGPALSATMFQPRGMAVASDGTIYFADTGNFRIRRIRTDGVIETVAGTGINGAGGDGGLAVNAEISDVLAIALDPSESLLYIADDNNHAVRRVNLVTGVMEYIAFVPFPQGIAVDSSGAVLVSETVSCAIRRVEPSTGAVTPFVGDPCTETEPRLLFPTRLSIDDAGNVYVVEAGTDRVRRVDAATGEVTTVAGGGPNPVGSGPATSFSMGVLTDVAVGGPNELFVSNHVQVFRVDLTTGLLTVHAGTGVPDLDDACEGRLATACNLNNVGGLAYHDPSGRLLLADANNARIRAIVPPNAPSGDVSFIGTTLTAIDCPPGLTHVAGDLNISNNASAIAINCGAVESVAGNVTVNGNIQAVTIDLSNLVAVDGSVTIQGNSNVGVIDLGNLETVRGDVTITHNGAQTQIALGNLAGVDGNVTIESHGSGTFTTEACVGGISIIDLAGYASVSAETAMGGTTLTLDDGSSMTLDLPPGAFPGCAAFSVARTAAVVETGADPSGQTVTIDPILTYEFVFAVTSLGIPAELTFDIDLSTLEPTRQAEVLEALASGRITLVTKGDDTGGIYQSFAVCGAGDLPAVDGCVSVQTLDANGNPTTGTPAVIRFTGVVGHFSTWGVAIVTSAPTFNGLLQPYPAPPHAATPMFKRGSVVPLKFNWVDPSGAAVDSATAAPSVTIYGGGCSGEPTTTPITPDDAGHSDGFRYDIATKTWVFGWNTKALAEGCYWIQIATGNAAYRSPTAMFPVGLR